MAGTEGSERDERPRSLVCRLGAVAVLLGVLFGACALGGRFVGQQAEWGASVDGVYAADGSAGRWAKFDVDKCAVTLAVGMLFCMLQLTVQAASPASSSGWSRKAAALLMICCVLGTELPTAEALSRPVVEGGAMLSDRNSYGLDGADASAGASTLPPNSSVSQPLPAAAPSAARHLLGAEGGAPAQQTEELVETPTGITDQDMSPTPPVEFMKQEERVDQLSDKMAKSLKKSGKRQEQMEKRVKKLDEMISDQLSDVATSVEQENKKLTDEIVEVPPVVGPTGPAGKEGPPGKDGANGIHGAPGAQGPAGPQGIHGVPGPIGPKGARGPYGPAGVPGTTGVKGSGGVIGPLGPEGKMGMGSDWKKGQYFCPEAVTATMRMLDCKDTGCLLETKFENDWGTVCSNGFNDQDANTLCRAFGFPEGGVAKPNHGGGKASAPIWLNDIDCMGDEGDVGDCRHAPWLENRCTHAEDAGLCCYGGRPVDFPDVRKGPSFFPRCPETATKDMRLVDCNRKVCRLEVKHEEKWGTVCDNGFTDMSATTVCKLLGFPKGKFEQMCSTQGKYGSCADNRKGKGPIWLDEVVCSGFERDLEGCRHRPWGDHKCTHKQDVGICCSGEKGNVFAPGKCRGGELYYKFNENLDSSSGGPALAAPWGAKFSGVDGVKFKEGQGLGVDPSGCIGPSTWTIYLRVKLDSTTGERAIVHSNGWADNGIFVKNSHFTLLPTDTELTCGEKIIPNRWYQYVISRDEAGNIRLYINGALCQHGKPDIPKFLQLNPDQLMFVADYGLRNPSGFINKVRVFDKVLTEDKVARLCGCKLPGRDKVCQRHIAMSPATSGLRFSSVWSAGWRRASNEWADFKCYGEARFGIPGRWSNAKRSNGKIKCSFSVFGDPAPGVRKHCQCKARTRAGHGYASGRMNSRQAWSAGKTKPGKEWMEVDTGSVQSISGIITQGRRDANQWVTSLEVKVSEDGKSWRSVACGRVFDTNVNRNTKVKNWFHEPVHGRYIRFYPLTWQGHPSMRAGVLVCERPCVGGKLDFKFGMSMMSSSLGPALEASWGEGEFVEKRVGDKNRMVYNFRPGEGLQIDQGRCLKASPAWTILIDVALTDTKGYRRLLGSQNWGDYGLYVNKYLMLIPKNSKMMCKEVIRPGKYYRYVMSRSTTGDIKLYINGELCASGKPPYKNNFQLDPHNVMFLRDDSGEDSGGDLTNIRLWNKELSASDVEAVCQCTRPDKGETCKNFVVYNAPYSKIHVTSYWLQHIKQDSKKWYNQGRIGSPSAWSAGHNRVGEYIQLDSGKVQTISGVVTQGRRDRGHQWVTTYTVQVSSDGADWRQVGCGREFDGNSDRSTKVRKYFNTPVKARYVRIYPQTWHEHMSMRAGLLLCEKPCKDNRLDYPFQQTFASRSDGPSLDPAWGEGEFRGKLGADGYRFTAGQGLELDASRCFKKVSGWTMLMKVKLDQTYNGRKALMTSDKWDDDQYGLYVDKWLRLSPSGANMVCDDITIKPNTFYWLGMTRADDGTITLSVNGAACAKGKPKFKDHYQMDPKEMRFLIDQAGHNTAGYVKSIKLWGKHLDEYDVAAKTGCLLPKRAVKKCLLGYIPLTGTTKTVKFSSIEGKSKEQRRQNSKSRLGSTRGWFPSSNRDQWMQIDTGRIQTIAGVVTQGGRSGQGWVTFYTVKVSDDGFQWKDVRCQWRFQGNSDASTKKKNLFNYPVTARYIRIYPKNYHRRVVMRAGVLICMMPCEGGQLRYRLDKGNLLSMTDGPALDAAWGSGFFAGDDGYRFGPGKGFQVDQDVEGCMNNHPKKKLKEEDLNTAYTIVLNFKMDQTWRWARIFGSKGWGDKGLYYHLNRLRLVGSPLSCMMRFPNNHWFTIGLTRDEKGNLGLYANGALCDKGAPMVLKGFQLDRNNIDFFHDDGNENSAGYVKDIWVYNKALDEKQMADLAGCHLSEFGTPCARTIVYSPRKSQTKYSSIYANNKPGYGYGQGTLNSPRSWSAAGRSNQWMQIDVDMVRSIAGVVTQGRREANQWVTSFTVQTSLDGTTWVPVECGYEFEGNRNRNTKVKTFFRRPVKARYVRILPTRYYNWISMRAGVLTCERKCEKGELQYPFRGNFMSATKGPNLDAPWGEGSWTRWDSLGYRFHRGQGLVLDESRCINPSNWTVLVKARFDQTHGWRKVMGSDTWGWDGLYINQQFQMVPKSSMMKCNERILPNVYYNFMMSRGAGGMVNLYLNGYKCSWGVPPFHQGFKPSPTSLEFFHGPNNEHSAGYVKRIAVWDRVLTDEECATESECKLAEVAKPCNQTVTLIPPYSRMRVSSFHHHPRPGSQCNAGRLGSSSAWCPRHRDKSEWIEIDVGFVHRIAGVVTQGRRNYHQWVTSYKAMVSKDGVRWFDVQCGTVFQGNRNRNTKVVNIFDHAVVGRYIRVFPQSWYGFPSMRMGALICEKPCKQGLLDYQLLDDLQSQTMGPELQPVGGMNPFNLDYGYRVYHNRGLMLNSLGCVDEDGAYTVMIKVRFDFVGGWRRILNSRGWGDNGLYLRNGLLTLNPRDVQQCAEYIYPRRFYKIGMTRTAKHQVSLYINGYRCTMGYPNNNDGFALNPTDISFFKDESHHEYTNAWVKRIRVWDRALDPGEMAEAAGCSLIPAAGKKCTDTITYSPPSKFTKFSSTWGHNSYYVKRYSRVRLNSPQGWSSRHNNVGQWVQFDTEKVQTIAGVVTQGRRDCEQRVTSYKVSISDDGKVWRQVQCGMAFNGNTDRNTKVFSIFDRPIKARYVRIYPQTWNQHMSMRAGVVLCEQPCKKDKLEYRFKGSFMSSTDGPSLTNPWGAGWFSDRYGYRFGRGQGLALNEKNCIGPEWTVSIRARLDHVHNWGRIMGSQAWGDYGLFVKKNEFLLFPRSANIRCQSAYIEPNRYYTFWMSRSKKGVVKLYIDGYLCSKKSPALADHFALSPDDVSFFKDPGSENTGGYVKRIQMYGKALPDNEVASLSGCVPPKEQKKCDLNVEFNAPYSQITYSCVWARDRTGYHHGSGRLDARGTLAWSACRNDLNQFMQVDVGKVRPIAGVVTQGRRHTGQYVTAYSVEVSKDGQNWEAVQCGAPFKGNFQNNDERVTNLFNAPVMARYVKIRPTSWRGHISMRAGVVMCEEPCKKGDLDFTMDHSFLSQTDGPPLQTKWGEGRFTNGGYRFYRGQGLQLRQISCLKNPKVYSIVIDAKIDHSWHWNRLLSAGGWGRYGMFVKHRKFMLYPEDLEMVCPGIIFNGDMNKFGITREAGGRVRLYLNGYMCAEGEPTDAPRAMMLNKRSVDFFRDPSHLHGSGTVSRIRLWSKALNADKMAEAMGCRKPEVATQKCKSVVIYNPPYSQIKFSATLGNHRVGTGWARGRLNSPRSWIAPYYGRNWWMQMDSGEVQAVAGVVTQGRGDGWWWTTRYFVKVSVDGRKWRKVECGRIFDGNRDAYTQVRNLFAQPVKARYVRIYPQESHGYPSLRAAVLVCEGKCKNGHLDYPFNQQLTSVTKGPSLDAAWGQGRFYHHRPFYRFYAGKGLKLDEANCLKNKKAWSMLMHVRLDHTHKWRALMTAAGWGTNGLFVGDGFLATKPQELACPEIIRRHYWYKFGMTRAADGRVRLFVNGYECAIGKPSSPKKGFELDEHDIEFFRGDKDEQTNGYVKRIQLWAKALTSKEMASASDCSLPAQTGACKGEVTMTTRDNQMKASSVWGNYPMGGYYARGSLNSNVCWMPGWGTHGNGREWLQVDTGKLQSITGVVTRGAHGRNWFVRTFKVKVSEDGRIWRWVECGRIFDGNKNWHSKVTNLFQNPVKARYIRFYPLHYYWYAAMRVGVIVCEADCKEKELDYRLRQTLMSSTGGPSLSLQKHEGHFTHRHGYRFHRNNGLQLNQQHCFKDSKAYTVIMDVWLDSVSNWNGLITNDKWGDNGLYVGDGKFRLKPTEILCTNEKIRRHTWYKLGITRAKEGDVTLFINGYPCAEGKPKSSKGFVLSSTDLQLLGGPDGQGTGGYVKRIQVWGAGKSDEQMQDLMNCRLAKKAKGKCDGSVIMNAPYNRIRASTVWAGHRIQHGYYYGRARLHAHGAWCAGRNDRKQWLQIDTGKVQNIAGVVTEGRYYTWQWVTSYKVQVSKNGFNWYDVECGRIFDGNRNYHQKVKNKFETPVVGRYVRIRPYTWYNHISMRAGVLICEGDCKNKHLDYDFDQSLASITDGPSLKPEWGEGYYNSHYGYLNHRHQGMVVKQQNCFKGLDQWSVLYELYVPYTHVTRQLMGSSDWGNFGAFMKKRKFGLKGGDECKERLEGGYFYKYGITRNKKGEVKLYLNGWLCAEGKPGVMDNYKLGKDLTFVRSNKKHPEERYSWSRRLQIWGKTLSDDEMAKEAECVKPPEGEACSGKPMEAIVPYNRMSASSVRWGYRIGHGWGKSQLNSNSGWAMAYHNRHQYLQFDLGKVMSVSGVRTQGDGGWYRWYFGRSWIYAYWVDVSDDGNNWKKVQCGQIFQGNRNNRDTVTVEFDTPVKARYVRIKPQRWYGWATLRATLMVCESSCKTKKLDYGFRHTMASSDGGGPALTAPWGWSHYWSPGQWHRKGYGYRFWRHRGLRVIGEDACIRDPKTYSVLINVMFDNDHPKRLVNIMRSSDWGDSGLYLDDGFFTLKPNSQLKCSQTKIMRQVFYKFGMTRAKDGTVTLFINGMKCASGKPKSYDGFKMNTKDLIFFRGPGGRSSAYGWVDRIQLWDKVLSETEMMKKSDCEPAQLAKKKCDSVTANVNYERMRFSSVAGNYAPGISGYGKGRLNSQASWWPAHHHNQWMQMDTGKKQTISGVVTQGRYGSWHWVTSFRVEVSTNGKVWKDVECGKAFPGNKDFSSKVKTHFSKPVVGRYVRIYPLQWRSWPALRAAVLVCETDCKSGHLDYQMEGMRSVTGGPALESPWGEGDFVPQTKDNYANYPYYDIGYHWVTQEPCDRLCKSNPSCAGYIVHVSGYPGCWLKSKMNIRYRYESQWYDAYFNTDSLTYKTEAPVGYKFNRGKGLSLDPSHCIKDTKSYTVIMTAMVKHTHHWRKLLSSAGWGDKGLYIHNSRLTMYPSASGLKCEGLIRPEYAYTFALTRSEKGEVKIYLNGYKCAESFPSYADGYRLKKDNIDFFKDTNWHYMTGGVIRRIQMWDKTLSEKEVGKESGCSPADTSNKKCKSVKRFTPNKKQVDMSSIHHRDDIGVGYGGGYKLDSHVSWLPKTYKRGEWIQVDLGKVRNVTGVTTQGNYHHNWKVTAFTVSVSKDGQDWADVECGKMFETPYRGYWQRRNDKVESKFDKMNEGRYVRLIVSEWYNLPSLRMQVNYCDDKVVVKKKEKKLKNPCKGKKKKDHCNPCAKNGNNVAGKQMRKSQCTGKKAKKGYAKMCQWKKNKGCFPKKCKRKDWKCYLTAFDSSKKSKKAAEVVELNSRDFSCDLYDYGAFRPMDGTVSLEDKCNNDSRCQHHAGCGCLAKGATCATPESAEDAADGGEEGEESGAEDEEEEEGDTGVHLPEDEEGAEDEGVKAKAASEDHPDVDDSDPLGLIKAHDEKFAKGEAPAEETEEAPFTKEGDVEEAHQEAPLGAGGLSGAGKLSSEQRGQADEGDPLGIIKAHDAEEKGRGGSEEGAEEEEEGGGEESAGEHEEEGAEGDEPSEAEHGDGAGVSGLASREEPSKVPTKVSTDGDDYVSVAQIEKVLEEGVGSPAAHQGAPDKARVA